MTQGKFIVIDGTDGSGKGTQTKKLVDRLKSEGRPVELIDFPRYGNASAAFVEKYLRGEYGNMKSVGPYRASIFYALDRYDLSSQVQAWLEAGTIVISNRYVSASKGHQAAQIQDPEERASFLAWLNHLEYDLFGIPKPDLTILLHVPADIGYELVASKDARGYLDGKKRDIIEGDREHLRAAEQAYLELSRTDAKENWKIFECIEEGKLLSIDEIHERLWKLLIPILHS